MGVPGTLWEHSAVKDCSGSYHTVTLIRRIDSHPTKISWNVLIVAALHHSRFELICDIAGCFSRGVSSYYLEFLGVLDLLNVHVHYVGWLLRVFHTHAVVSHLQVNGDAFLAQNRTEFRLLKDFERFPMSYHPMIV